MTRSSSVTHKSKKKSKKKHSKRSRVSDSSSISDNSNRSSYSRHERKKMHSKKKKSKHRKKERRPSTFYDDMRSAATKMWGSRGILAECDMFRKRPEFHAWLLEVKKYSIECLPSWEEKQLFKDYMEDYNTATLPHDKYYDLETWHAREAKKGKKHSEEPTERIVFDDERTREAEVRKLQKERRQETMKSEFEAMQQDLGKVSQMRRQQMLKHKMEVLFKTGRTAEARKIQDLLKPEAY